MDYRSLFLKLSAWRYSYFLLLLAYALLAFFLPINPTTLKHYHLTASSAHWWVLSIIIPLILIWLLIFYGYSRLYRYASTISQSKEGQGMMYLVTGLGIIAFGYPITSIVSNVLSFVSRNHPHFLSTATIINNYLSLLLSLTAFLFISWSARKFTDSIKMRPSQIAIYILSIAFICVGVAYCYMVFRNAPGLGLSAGRSVAYYLPNWLLLLTVVVPYIFIWFIGLLAAYELHIYEKKVRGIIYKQSMKLVSAGLAAIIVSSVFTQFLVTLSNQLLRLRFRSLILLIYLLLIVISLGYILVAAGAKKLQKIEEV